VGDDGDLVEGAETDDIGSVGVNLTARIYPRYIVAEQVEVPCEGIDDQDLLAL